MEYLVLTNRARRCRACREWTWWSPASAIRSDWGLCLDHADDYPCEDAPVDTLAALRVLRAAFPQLAAGRAPESHAEARTHVGGTWVKGGGTWLRECPPPRTDAREPHERRWRHEP
jgi:hypothetical protein